MRSIDQTARRETLEKAINAMLALQPAFQELMAYANELREVTEFSPQLPGHSTQRNWQTVFIWLLQHPEDDRAESILKECTEVIRGCEVLESALGKLSEDELKRIAMSHYHQLPDYLAEPHETKAKGPLIYRR